MAHRSFVGSSLRRALAVGAGTLSAVAVAATGSSLSSLSSAAGGLPALARAEAGYYAAGLPTGTVVDCTGPAGDPAPGTAAWHLRDLENEYCATGRLADEYANPAFGATFAAETPGLFAAQNLAMAETPGHLHLTLGQLVPGGTTADPFRTLARWTAAHRGRVTPISFPATDGATLNGYLFEPPTGSGPFPGVVITTGSIQGYQQMYFWAAEGLAEAGYMVMTYDVQGQGDSDTLPASCTPSVAQLEQQQLCTGVPFQQSYNFYQGAEDSLNYFFSTPAAPYRSAAVAGSTYNPAWAALDTAHVGIAGHSLGASAVSEVGQCDPRVKAVVAWDNLAPTAGPCAAQIPTGLPAGSPLDPTDTVPALGINSEYFFNPEPMQSPPDPQAKAAAYEQLAATGTDAMQVALRSSMHLEYSFVPYILPASQLGERVAFYYTLAWFDDHLRGMSAGFDRLVARSFDTSADVHAIGAGGYDPEAAAADPTDPAAGNVPHRIAGLPVDDRMSIYYDSEYSLTPPDGGTRATCLDMRADCPTSMPTYP